MSEGGFMCIRRYAGQRLFISDESGVCIEVAVAEIGKGQVKIALRATERFTIDRPAKEADDADRERGKRRKYAAL